MFEYSFFRSRLSQLTPTPDPVHAVPSLDGRWIARADSDASTDLLTWAGAFHLYDDLPSHLFNPGFFRTMAGIGYTLLRLAANGEVGANCLA
jgi:hypothetical protein